MTCLVDHGFAGTTMQRVQTSAGVSRGALVHHFPTMEDLLVGAIGHVARRQLDELRVALTPLVGGEDERDRTVRLLHSYMSGPLFLAGLELWLAARTNPSLRHALIPIERDLGHELREAFAAYGSHQLVTPADLDQLLVVLRGLAITSVLRPDTTAENQVIERWLARVS